MTCGDHVTSCGDHVTSCGDHVTSCGDHVTLFSCSLRDIAMANWRSSSSCSWRLGLLAGGAWHV